MSDVNDYILDSIRTWVWSGFYSPDEVDLMIDDILEEGADEEMISVPPSQTAIADSAIWIRRRIRSVRIPATVSHRGP